jgi:hypothetical protein
MKTPYLKILFFLTLFSWKAFAGSLNDDKDKPKENQPAQVGAAALSPQMKLQLDAALEKLNAQMGSSGVSYVDNMADLISSPPSPDKDKAQQTFAYLDKDEANRYRETLDYNDLVKLPVGLRKKLSDNSTADIGILSASFEPTFAKLTIFVRLKTTINDPNSVVKERELFFGVKDIKFTREGGLTGDFTAVLLGDYIIPMGNWVIKLKGGLDMNTGEIPLNATYAEMGCGQFKQAYLNAEVIFPNSVIVPFNETTRKAVTDGSRVTAQFQTFITSGLRDVLISINSNQAFAVKGYEKVGFKLNNLVLDLSDQYNSSGMAFPANYTGDKSELWRGVYLKNFSVLLPPEFNSGGTNYVSFGASDVLIDRLGFSGKIFYNNTTQFNDLDASGWKITLSKFELEILTNKFQRGSFGGDLYVPVSDAPFKYAATIDLNGNYGMTVTNTGALDFNFWKANATILPGSSVELAVVNGRFKPKAILSGSLGIKTNLGTDAPTEAAALVNFKGITFTNLVLQTETPKVSFGSLGYQNTGHGLANFPLTISSIQLNTAAPNDEFWLTVGVNLNLMDNGVGVSSSTTVTIKAVESATGRLQFKGFSNGGVEINRILIAGNFSAFRFDGEVCIFDNDPVFGKGFAGKLDLLVKKPEIRVCVVAQFGRKTDAGAEYRYWRGEGLATFPAIPVAPPLAINGAALALYSHMAPSTTAGGNLTANGCTITNCSFSENTSASSGIKYVPNKDIALGIRATVSLTLQNAEKAFKGEAGLEMIFNSSWGLNSVGLFGEATLTVDPAKIAPDLTKLASKLGTLANYATPTTASTQANLSTKAKTQFAGSGVQAGVGLKFGLLLTLGADPSLHGEAEVTISVAAGNTEVLYGRKPGKVAGDLTLHFDKDLWYIHVGNPNSRIGVKADVKVLTVDVNAYLMIGYGVPTILPPPPPKVISLFTNYSPPGPRATNEATAIKEGKGFALGAAVEAELRLNIPRTSIKVGYGYFGVGFDILMSNPPPAPCTLNNGVNGWYVQGQGFFGVQAEVLKFANVSFASVLTAGAPNPTWFEGRIELCIVRKWWGNKKCIIGIKTDFSVGDSTCN